MKSVTTLFAGRVEDVLAYGKTIRQWYQKNHQ
jgi:hypothetical protein